MKKTLPVLLLVAAAFCAYVPALRNGIVWDDTALILRDPFIRSWRLIPESFQHFLFTDATASDFYRPIQRLTYTIDYAAYGVRPFGYHLTSIAWHAAAAVALFFLATELLRYFGVEQRRNRFVSCGAAFVWAIHPAHTGAVAYISGRSDALAAAFGFAGLAVGIWSRRVDGVRRWIGVAIAAALLLLSALSKEAGLTFLALWIVTFLLGRNWKNVAHAAIASLFVLTIYLSLRLGAEHVPPEHIHAPAPLLVRPILVARAFAEYTSLTFAPVNLHMERDVETHPNGFGDESLARSAWRELETLAGLILLSAFIYWLVRERKRDRAVFGCLVLAATTYLPVSGVVPLNATIAEHWLYLPSGFLFVAVALCVARVVASERRYSLRLRVATAAILTLWTLFIGARCFIRTFDWKDQRTFFENTIAAGGDSPRMLINLAGVEMEENRLDAAMVHLQAALAKEPDQPLAVLNLGAVAVKQGDYRAAHELLARATTMPLVAAQAHELLAVYANRENGTVDLLRLRLASRTGPSNWWIEKRYIKVLAQSVSIDRALAELQKCLQTQWYRAESWQLAGELLRKAGQQSQAEAAFANARRYDVRLSARPAVL